MIFKKCKWCKYSFPLQILDSRGNYKDSLCCTLPLYKHNIVSVIRETRPMRYCAHFDELVKRPHNYYDKGKNPITANLIESNEYKEEKEGQEDNR